MMIEAFPMWEQIEKESGVTLYKCVNISCSVDLLYTKPTPLGIGGNKASFTLLTSSSCMDVGNL